MSGLERQGLSRGDQGDRQEDRGSKARFKATSPKNGSPGWRPKSQKAAEEIVPVLTAAIQANWYWNYLPAKPLAFMQRTATADFARVTAASPPGICPRIFAEIDKQFTAAARVTPPS